MVIGSYRFPHILATVIKYLCQEAFLHKLCYWLVNLTVRLGHLRNGILPARSFLQPSKCLVVFILLMIILLNKQKLLAYLQHNLNEVYCAYIGVCVYMWVSFIHVLWPVITQGKNVTMFLIHNINVLWTSVHQLCIYVYIQLYNVTFCGMVYGRSIKDHWKV